MMPTPLLALGSLAVIVTLIVPSLAPPAQTISGQAIIVDGDSLYINKVPIRLYGIDAPEIAQTCTDEKHRRINCGLLAADVLAEEIGGSTVACVPVQKDQYERTVAVCKVRDKDLARVMVERGYARDYPFYSQGRYRDAEDEARRERRGLWAGEWQNPRDWRRENRR